MTITLHNVPLWGTILSVILGLSGLFLIYISALDLAMARKSTRWQQVKGKMLEINIVDLDARAGKSKPADGSESNGKVELSLKYKYELAGVTHVGTRISPWSEKFLTDAMKRTAYDKLKQAQDIVVYYAPSNPAKSSVLIGGGPLLMRYFLMGFLLLFTAIIMIAAIVVLRTLPTIAGNIHPIS
jgi:hypothetical protein